MNKFKKDDRSDERVCNIGSRELYCVETQEIIMKIISCGIIL